MQSLANAAPTVKTVNKTNVTFAVAASIPFTYGVQDAQNALTPVPEMYFTHIEDQRDYCRGYASVTGPTPTTRQFLGGNN